MTSNDEKWEMALKRARAPSRPQTQAKTKDDEFQEAVLRAKTRSLLNPRNSEERENKERFENARREAAVRVIQKARQTDIRNYASGSGCRPKKTIPRIVPETTPVPGVQVQEMPYKPEQSLESKVEQTPKAAEENPLIEGIEIHGVTTGEKKNPESKKQETKPIKLEDVVKAAPVEIKTKPVKISRFTGAPLELYDVGTLFENLGLHGQRKSAYRCLFNVIAKKPHIIVGPSGAGKTTMAEFIVELVRIIDPSLVAEYNKITGDELIQNSDLFKRKILYFPEAQTVIRGSGDKRDLFKAIFGGERYKNFSNELDILFAFSAVASTNPYWEKYLKNDPEFKSRANIVYIDASLDGLVGHRNSRTAKRSGQEKKKEVSISKEELAAFLISRMMMEIPKDKVIDPSSAFVDQYVPLTFSANRYIEHYEEDENTVLKWYNNEDGYEVNGKTIFILGLRNKYRAERLRRRDIIKSIKETDNLAYAKKIGWSEGDIERLKKTLEKAEEEVDWQACWDSYLESLRASNAPPELISEVINRHVVNGKITVIDPLTGEEVLLAQYPKPVESEIKSEKTVVTDIKGAFDEYSEQQPETGIEGVVSESNECHVETKLIDSQKIVEQEEPIPAEKNEPKEHKYEFMGNSYDSIEEAACAVLMQKYIQSFEPEEDETIHVKKDMEATIDFSVNGSFIEYHPVALCKLDNGFGDFPSQEAFEQYKSAREELPEEERKKFDEEVRKTLAENYFSSRVAAINRSLAHQGKELILATNPEEVYDSVITRFGENYPSKDEFLDEFRMVKKIIRENMENESP